MFELKIRHMKPCKNIETEIWAFLRLTGHTEYLDFLNSSCLIGELHYSDLQRSKYHLHWFQPHKKYNTPYCLNIGIAIPMVSTTKRQTIFHFKSHVFAWSPRTDIKYRAWIFLLRVTYVTKLVIYGMSSGTNPHTKFQ